MHTHPSDVVVVRRIVSVVIVGSLALGLSACGGSDDPASVSASGPGTPAPTASYSVAGSLSGLDGGGTVTLLNNGANALPLAANGPFSFTSSIAFNTAYAVSVGAQPLWQYCQVANGSGIATANVTNVGVSCSAARAQVLTLAGSVAAGAADGTGAAASFSQPVGVTVDGNGNVYVADSFNNKIRKITAAGVVTTFAGSGAQGHADGAGAAATFHSPYGVAVDGNGNVYVADTGNSEIRKITPAGVVTTFAGSTLQGAADGTGSAASFMFPYGIAVDGNGIVYVADSLNNKIRKITPAGSVTTLAGSGAQGHADGIGPAATFDGPWGITVDGSGNIYTADWADHLIRKVSPAGGVTTLAGSGAAGAADGIGAAASFDYPVGVVADREGNLYVGDSNNNEIRKITPAGVVTTLAGSATAGSTDGIGTAASFSRPNGVAMDISGNLYVGDFSNSEIRKLVPIQ